MEINRRSFLRATGGFIAAGLLNGGLAEEAASRVAAAADQPDWDRIRGQFELDPGLIHLAGLLLASNPLPVREAIARHRQALDENPVQYANQNRLRLEHAARRAAASYLGVGFQEVALADSTTMGIGLVYNGLRIREDQEMLTTDEDYYSTHQALRHKQRDSGAGLRQIALFERAAAVSEDEIVETLIAAVRPETRLLALTWVHSKTGLKLPVRRLADELAGINADRAEDDRVLLGIDGVHGLGVENFTMEDLGCDFFMAGTHKWLFGPRGTGIVWGSPQSREMVRPLVPTFTHDDTWGGSMTPGGFKPFEHQWALSEAFAFHEGIGRERVTDRIHQLSRQCREGLAGMDHVTLHTPLADNLASGIVCFDVSGLRSRQVVSALRARGIVASVTPYAVKHARLTPGIINTPEEIDRTLAAVRDLG